jgi:hypothetical protein
MEKFAIKGFLVQALRIVLATLLFSLTYEWAKEGSVLPYTRLECLAKDKHSNLLGPLVSERGVEHTSKTI